MAPKDTGCALCPRQTVQNIFIIVIMKQGPF